jgi:hypothetical protein
MQNERSEEDSRINSEHILRMKVDPKYKLKVELQVAQMMINDKQVYTVFFNKKHYKDLLKKKLIVIPNELKELFCFLYD